MSQRSARLSQILSTMKQRCYNPNKDNYNNYGGRGIKICDEWNNREIVATSKGSYSKGYLAFKKWALENGYQDNLTIDRIDPNGNYEPSNCRWVSMKVQSNNKTNNHFVTYKDKTQTIKQWCDELNLNYTLVRKRIQIGWKIEKAFETPARHLTRR